METVQKKKKVLNKGNSPNILYYVPEDLQERTGIL
jgi:hypothetical protein